MVFDKWTLLKVFEVGFVVSCFICKKVTDDEASRLFLYLQKLSREWSLLNNITWDKAGAAVADTTYGGYIIITAALLIGRIANELPTQKRVMEIILLGIGTVLFVAIGSLVFAALDSVPPDLVDNAAVLGTLSLITGALFLLDLGGPKAKTPETQKKISRPSQTPGTRHDAYDIEPDLARIERKQIEALEEQHSQRTKPLKDQREGNGFGKNDQNGNGPKIGRQNGFKVTSQHGYKKMKDSPNRFDIYGKDVEDSDDEKSRGETEEHSPVWSQIRKGQYGKYDVVVPSFLYIKPDAPTEQQESHPSSPADPGYVQYTAKRWGQPPGQKTPRHSPTQV